MRASTLIAAGALSLGGLISACATSPHDELGLTTAEATATVPTEDASSSVKLPPRTSPSDVDSGTDAAQGSSGSCGSSGSSGGVGPACNVSDPLKLVIYQVEVSNQATPVPCPCPATKCCYLGVTCIAP